MASHKGVIEFLYSLEKHGIKPGLERIGALLASLGNPQDSFRSMHVAGTNGKGSVCAMTASILNEAGVRTGLYTSPHLSKFNERITVSGKPITDKELVEAASITRAAASKAGLAEITFFEFTTAMAFVHFREKLVEFAVIETGMGGRLDATNLAVPMVSVITNIDLDHTAWLGRTIREIAFEKAGIIKPGAPVITGVEQKQALSVIRSKAKEAASPVYLMGEDFHARRSEKGLVTYSGISGGLEGIKAGLQGAHQTKNAALALAAVEVLRKGGLDIKESAIRAGMRKTRWPGRFETLSGRPLVILDGAHNPAGARALKEALEGVKRKRLILVIGMMSDKEMDGILKELVPSSSLVIATAPRGERAARPDEIMELAAEYKKPVIAVPTVKDACKRALSEASPSDCVCISGSLFTVGEAREYLTRSLARKKGRPCK